MRSTFVERVRRQGAIWGPLVLAIVLASQVVAVAEESSTPPPNVIYLLADDLGYSELGCYGQKWIKTPNIDRIAHEGIRFTRHYSGNAVCAPSRCCLMTGKHPGHAFTRNNGNPKYLQHMKEEQGWEFPGQHPMPPSEVTIAEMLKQKGYATAAAGKWGLGHFGTTGDPNRQGFDLFYGFNLPDFRRKDKLGKPPTQRHLGPDFHRPVVLISSEIVNFRCIVSHIP